MEIGLLLEQGIYMKRTWGFPEQSILLFELLLVDHLPDFNMQHVMQTKALENGRNEVCDWSQHDTPTSNSKQAKTKSGLMDVKTT